MQPIHHLYKPLESKQIPSNAIITIYRKGNVVYQARREGNKLFLTYIDSSTPRLSPYEALIKLQYQNPNIYRFDLTAVRNSFGSNPAYTYTIDTPHISKPKPFPGAI